MLKKRTHTKRKAQNKQNLVTFAWRNPVPNPEPNPNLQFPAVRERLPGGPLLLLLPLLPLTDNRSDWHTQRMSVQVRHESGSTLSWWGCSWLELVASHTSRRVVVALRCMSSSVHCVESSNQKKCKYECECQCEYVCEYDCESESGQDYVAHI